MTSRSFRIFATKDDLLSIFLDFQHNTKIHYFKCGRMYNLIETSDITKDTLFGINIKGNHTNNQYSMVLAKQRNGYQKLNDLSLWQTNQ